MQVMNLVFKLIEKEKIRQKNGLEMIPSENYVSKDVLKALGSILTNKYSEGFPGRRYYGGNFIIDEIEEYCIKLAKKIFNVEHAIVQPYSGSPANLAVDLALVSPGEVILGMDLYSGGHLTHGASVSQTGKLFNAITYSVRTDGKINMVEVENLAKKNKPKLIWVGATAYPYKIDFKSFSEIAEKVGAYLVADISHIAGLIVGGAHPSPTQYVDVITTTTHKTLRGPKGAMILITKKGLKKDPEISEKLEKTIFPGLQGGPHNHQTAAIAVCLEEALKANFKKYVQQIVKNAKVLADGLGCKTENHLILWDLSKYGFGLGFQMQIALEQAGITVNKNTVPGEESTPFYPSGIRLGAPALTSRGMKEKEMKQIVVFIKQVLEEVKGYDLPENQSDRKEFIEKFKLMAIKNSKLKLIRKNVENLVKKFPVPGE